MDAIIIKVAGIGLKINHLGKTLAEMQPTLLKLASQDELIAPGNSRKLYCRTTSMDLTFVAKEENTRHSPWTAHCLSVA